MRTVMHLTASRGYGGPERQMIGLAQSLPRHYRTVFASFAEGGRCEAFLDEVRRHEFETVPLRHDTPRLFAALRELTAHLRRIQADVLCCHGYKANVLGRLAARKVGIPAVAVSHGWTWANLKVRLYEMLDRAWLRCMDRVICVSEGQAEKVRRAGVPDHKVVVIRNAISPERFQHPDPAYRDRLQAFFPRPCRQIMGAAGRLSPEKGFDILIRAAKPMLQANPGLGIILFGDGPLRKQLAGMITSAGLTSQFILAGHRGDLDHFLPLLDLLVLPSYTEGLPNVVLEAFAAGIPVVGTAAGGTPELIEDGRNGYLVPPGNVELLRQRIGDVLASDTQRQAMGLRGRQRVRQHFSFAQQSAQYHMFFDSLLHPDTGLSAKPRAGKFRSSLVSKITGEQYSRCSNTEALSRK